MRIFIFSFLIVAGSNCFSQSNNFQNGQDTNHWKKEIGINIYQIHGRAINRNLSISEPIISYGNGLIFRLINNENAFRITFDVKNTFQSSRSILHQYSNFALYEQIDQRFRKKVFGLAYEKHLSKGPIMPYLGFEYLQTFVTNQTESRLVYLKEFSPMNGYKIQGYHIGIGPIAGLNMILAKRFKIGIELSASLNYRNFTYQQFDENSTGLKHRLAKTYYFNYNPVRMIHIDYIFKR
jgi:Protein of unknown function (DUF3575)